MNRRFIIISFLFLGTIIFNSCASEYQSRSTLYDPFYEKLNNEDELEIIPVTDVFIHDLPRIVVDVSKETRFLSKKCDLKLLNVNTSRVNDDAKESINPKNVFLNFSCKKIGDELIIRFPYAINSSSSILANYIIEKGSLIDGSVNQKPTLRLGITEFGVKCECTSLLYFEFRFKTKTWNGNDFNYCLVLNNKILEMDSE